MDSGGATRVGAGVLRLVVGVLAIAVLSYAYGLDVAAGDANPFDYFGYFTNQTSLLVSLLLLSVGALTVARRRMPEWLMVLRGVGTTYSVIVAVVYNTLVPGTGSAPPWVSAALHVVLPVIVVLDWALSADRMPLAWRRLWIVLPYPLLWLVVVLVRGATDGWVPYGFLLPENGAGSLVLHIVGLSCGVVAAGAVVWAMSRLPRGRSAPGPRVGATPGRMDSMDRE